MVYIAPDHYSYKFKFDIDKLPAIQKDKVSSKLTFFGVVVGLFFIALSGFEIFSYFFGETEQSYDFNLPSQISISNIFAKRVAFDVFIMILGILIILISVLSIIKYKKIYFDGDFIKITHRPMFGEKKEEVEALYNYLGVLLKVEYYQLGLMNKNRYIIELYHKDKNKRVPLYISTSGKKVRQIWEYYAEKLKMPALFMTDHGLISRNYTELNKTLKEMAKKWHLKSLYRNDEDMPDSVKCRFKNNKVIVKEKRLFFDIYSILAFCGVMLLSALLIYAGVNYNYIVPHIGIWGFVLSTSLCLAIILYSLIIIFSKDVLIVTNRDIILGQNILFLRMDVRFLPKDKIEAVDIGHNPVTDRYYLSVITNERNIVFGKNMPIDDLRWVRGFVIREIVK